MKLVETKKTFYIEFLDVCSDNWYKASLNSDYLEFDNMQDAVACIFNLAAIPGYNKAYRVNETTEEIHTLYP